jgi:hypothetical protein
MMNKRMTAPTKATMISFQSLTEVCAPWVKTWRMRPPITAPMRPTMMSEAQPAPADHEAGQHACDQADHKPGDEVEAAHAGESEDVHGIS